MIAPSAWTPRAVGLPNVAGVATSVVPPVPNDASAEPSASTRATKAGLGRAVCEIPSPATRICPPGVIARAVTSWLEGPSGLGGTGTLLMPVPLKVASSTPVVVRRASATPRSVSPATTTLPSAWAAT